MDGKITLSLPDLIPDSALKREWCTKDVMCASDKRRQPNCTESMKQEVLKELMNMEEEDASSILGLAVQVFLYLLIEIYGDKLK